MAKKDYRVPAPRAAVGDSGLTRPDWTAGGPRNPQLAWLDKNENVDPKLASLTQKVIASVARHHVYAYPDCGPFYHKLANNLGVTPHNLALTTGSDGAIRAVFESFINPGDPVLCTTPTFAMYDVYCRMFGADGKTVTYQPSSGGPLLTEEAFIAKVREVRPKLVCLANPDSPTGTVFEPETLRRIVEAVGEAGSLMLIDEAYFPFYAHTVLPWINEYNHLIVTRTFSKAWGLAGLRIGFLAGCPELVKTLHKVRPLYEIGAFDLAVIDTMLGYEGEVQESVRAHNEGRDTFIMVMRDLDLKTSPSHGSFLHVHFGRHAARVHQALQGMVYYRQTFKDPCLEGFSRFSTAPLAVLQPIIAKICEVVMSAP